MGEFFNDLITYIALMDTTLKTFIVGFLAILEFLLIRFFIKKLINKDKPPKIVIMNILLIAIVTALLILFSRYTF